MTTFHIKIDRFVKPFRFTGSAADSDGPVYFYSNNTFFIYAITTNIQTQCRSKRPGIYIKVADVFEWIERIIL